MGVDAPNSTCRGTTRYRWRAAAPMHTAALLSALPCNMDRQACARIGVVVNEVVQVRLGGAQSASDIPLDLMSIAVHGGRANAASPRSKARPALNRPSVCASERLRGSTLPDPAPHVQPVLCHARLVSGPRRTAGSEIVPWRAMHAPSATRGYHGAPAAGRSGQRCA